VAAATAVTGGSELIRGSIEPLLFWGLMTVALFVVIRQFMMLNDHIALNRELERQAAGLREREEHLRSLVEHSSDVVGVTDREGVIRFQSASAERIFGYSGAAWVGHHLADLVHPSDRPVLERRLDQVLKASGHPITVDCRLRHNLGSWTPCAITITNLLYLPSVQGLVLNIRDVSERTELEEKVSYAAVHDALTNLANEAAFRTQLEQALANPILGRGIAVLILDLDDFKALNDRLGAPVGDQVLVSVGARLEKMVRPADAIRPGDVVARLRSDEFAILLRDMPNPDAAASVARRILQQFEVPFRLGREEVQVAATIGAAGLISGAESVDDLLKHADLALRGARVAGARYQRYLPETPASGFTSVA
jgi:diguanylate cyclase (GGDEF)-like protein/PAS domain S-box-containing protein